jgi:2-polyprenyl-3-methyl-5-hydroxy-6-metoxy-1,4-benzoquinol methylase
MLTSPPENIAAICQVIAEVNPKRLLDVGCAWGKFGLLARETLAAQDAERGDWTPEDKSRYLVGIEGAEYFQKKPYWRCIYDWTIAGDARLQATDYLKSFDLTLLIDVAEHWPMQEVAEFIDRSGKILVSTPKGVHMYKEEFYGKDCPKHQTQFDHAFFQQFPNKDYSTRTSFVYLLN